MRDGVVGQIPVVYRQRLDDRRLSSATIARCDSERATETRGVACSSPSSFSFLKLQVRSGAWLATCSANLGSAAIFSIAFWHRPSTSLALNPLERKNSTKSL